MKKIITTLLFLLLLAGGMLQAIPAKRVIRTVTQPDGTTLNVILEGDENFHYVTTTDWIMLQQAVDGFIKYAIASPEGVLTAGEFIAHNPEERGEQEKAYIKKINTDQISHSIWKKRLRVDSPWLSDTKRTKFPNQGTIRGLIILAQYKDVEFSANSTLSEFKDMMNAKGYSNNGATGSARDYFIDQSYGVFTPEFDVVGPVTLPENMSYYGGNNVFGRDGNAAKMIVDACYAADTLLEVDFSPYDFDNDGKVDLVYVIYAGYAEAQGGPSESVWPHAWNLEVAGFKDVRLDGKQVHSYACSSELRDNAGADLDGIGTFCHEFSHCLGLPDIYDTRYTGMVGMGSWSLMDQGSYNNGSRTPAGYSAYERYSVGWLTPTVLKEPQKSIELSPISTSRQAFLLVSDQNPDEYYTIENRQQSGWDAYLPGHGMMIVHVDYVPSLWENNIINSSAAGHPHLQIVPADNEFGSFTGDLFPGTTQNTSFTDESNPASALYSGGFLSKPINRIAEKAGVITFDFMHFVGTPIVGEATGITESGFTANWESVSSAASYILEVAACMTGRKSLSEEFSKFTKGSPTEVDEENIANELNVYTELPGWTGHEIYQAGGYVRIGNKTAEGSLMTPPLDFTKEREFTLCCRIKGSKSLINGYTFQLLDENGNILFNKTMMMDASEKTIYWTFTTDVEVGSICIRAKTAALLNNIQIYDGDVREQLENGETLTEPVAYDIRIEDISDNSYTLTRLAAEKRYIYNVYAKMNEEISKKSNKEVVKTKKHTGIDASTVNGEIYAREGLLCISAGLQQTVCIYTPSGLTVYTGVCKEGVNEIVLSTGLYILAIGTDRFKIYIP